MTADTLREIIRRQPFVPFRLQMSGGTSYDIFHPEMIAITKTSFVVAIYDQGQGTEEVPARWAYCSYLHITGTEDLRPAMASAASA